MGRWLLKNPLLKTLSVLIMSLSIVGCGRGSSDGNAPGSTAALTISPNAVTLNVNATQTFTASGGDGVYTYSLLSGGGAIDAVTGLYTAPATPDTVIVSVSDATQTAQATITVVASTPLSISPLLSSMNVNGVQTFLASGGVSPYTYSIVSGGGSINATTGAFIAPATAGTVIVRVTDSLSNTSNATVTVNAALAISPASPSVAVNGLQSFSATGGVSPYTYSIVSGGGSINATTGAFTAPASTGTVFVRVTDSLSNVSNATVTVVSGVSISPITKTLAVNNVFTSFTASGGVSPYTYSIVSGGGSINSSTGVYTAPATAGSAVVKVTDNLGQISTANVTVNAALAIAPPTVTITTANTTTFTVTGGVPTSTFSIVSGSGSVNSSTGVFTPSGTGTTTARATDSLGNTSDAVVTVNAALAITPSSLNLEADDTVTLDNTGGVDPMTYSMVSGSGNVDPVTGEFTAPSLPETDVIRVTDALGNTSNATVTVYASLTLSPLTVTVPVNGSQTFTAAGGLGARTFSMVSGGGSINATTGVFTASATAGTSIVRVTDSILNSLDATITLVSSLTISPTTLKLPVFSTATFSAVLGLAPYTYSVVSGGGSIVPGTGVYTGASTAGTGTVRVTDAGFNTSNATVTHVEPVELVSGTAHTCARYNDNSVKCWGLGTSGQLGGGNAGSMGDGANEGGDKLPFVNLGTGRTATQLAAGSSHSCALLDNATVKCWGLNSSGQLGYGDTTTRGTSAAQMGDGLPTVNLGTGRTALKIFAFYTTTCAILDNATLKCWGLNSSGQLGLGDTTTRGSAAGQMGDSLPAVSLGTGRTANYVTGGTNFTCALLDNATVKCWGAATYGQTGHGNTTTVGNAAGQMGDSLAVTNLGTGRTALKIAGGYSHMCAVLDNNTMKCWGRNQSGQLGQNNTTTYGSSAGTIGDSLPTVTLGFTPVQVYTGRQWSCALSSTNTVKCWGLNSSGQLLRGNTTAQGDSAGEMAALTAMNFGTSITPSVISVGQYFGCAIMTNKRIKCWGAATSGALLNASTTSHLGDSAGELGDSLPWVNH